MEGIPLHPRRPGPDQAADSRTTAELVRAASRDVYSGWSVPAGDGDPGESQQRAVEAQIVAAAEGRKPLYFDPWGEMFSEAFAEAYRKVLPSDVTVEARGGMLFVYKEDVVRVILESDPDFYLQNGETILESIARVSAAGENGELLGYGARSMMERPAHEVKIYKGVHLMLYFFVSAPGYKEAAFCANERALDFSRAFGWEDVRYEIIARE